MPASIACSSAVSMSCAVWIPGYGTLTPSAGWSERGSWSSRIVGQLLVATIGVAALPSGPVRPEPPPRPRMPPGPGFVPHPEWVALKPGSPSRGPDRALCLNPRRRYLYSFYSLSRSRLDKVRNMPADPADLLRQRGYRAPGQRLAVLRAVSREAHVTADAVAETVRGELGAISLQAVYDVLGVLVDVGLVRRIQPAGSPARF